MQNPNENNLPIIQQNNLQVVDNQLTITDFLLEESKEVVQKRKEKAASIAWFVKNVKVRTVEKEIAQLGKLYIDLGITTFENFAIKIQNEYSLLAEKHSKLHIKVPINDFLKDIWVKPLPEKLDNQRRSLSELASLQLQKKNKITSVLLTKNLFEHESEIKKNYELISEQEQALLIQALKVGKAALNLGIVNFKDFSNTVKGKLGNDFILLFDSRESTSFENYLEAIWETALPISLDKKRRSLSELAAEKQKTQ